MYNQQWMLARTIVSHCLLREYYTNNYEASLGCSVLAIDNGKLKSEQTE